jgi:uncharacterized protein with GYD domain
MPTYLILANWTPKGIDTIKNSPSRFDAAKQALGSSGVTLKDFYMLLGPHDMALIVDAPDDATLARVLLETVSKGGAIRTQTFRAFTEGEYREIVGGIS